MQNPLIPRMLLLVVHLLGRGDVSLGGRGDSSSKRAFLTWISKRYIYDLRKSFSEVDNLDGGLLSFMNSSI